MFSILNSEPARGQIRPTVWKFFFSFLRRPATGMTAGQKVALKSLHLRSRRNPRAADNWPVNCCSLTAPCGHGAWPVSGSCLSRIQGFARLIRARASLSS